MITRKDFIAVTPTLNCGVQDVLKVYIPISRIITITRLAAEGDMPEETSIDYGCQGGFVQNFIETPDEIFAQMKENATFSPGDKSLTVALASLAATLMNERHRLTPKESPIRFHPVWAIRDIGVLHLLTIDDLWIRIDEAKAWMIKANPQGVTRIRLYTSIEEAEHFVAKACRDNMHCKPMLLPDGIVPENSYFVDGFGKRHET